PLLAQFWVAQHRGDDGCPVRRGIAVVGADADANLRERPLRGFAAACDKRESPNALAVEAKILGEGAADEQLAPRLSQFAQASGVFDDPVAEALVGEIDEWQEAAVVH